MQTFLWSTTIAVALILQLTPISHAQLAEDDRLHEYHARKYTWPIPKFTPDTPGWSNLMTRRLEQVGAIEQPNARYNGYLQTMHPALVTPNFTENGWGLTRAPHELVVELRKSLMDGLSNNRTRLERKIDVIEHDDDNIDKSRPLFIDQLELNQKAMDVLKPMHESWAGMPLIGSTAYGLRIYRNESALNMHVDKSESHIISCILHVGHDDDPDSEDWPIVIEDFQGNTNEVVLEAGDMLFYESSKCLHGRPRKFKGQWYSSLFVHYQPVDWRLERDPKMEAHFAVPPHWVDALPRSERLPAVEMVGTSIKEPECEHQWCGLQNSVKWRGPAIEGTVITTGFQYPEQSASVGEVDEDLVKNVEL